MEGRRGELVGHAGTVQSVLDSVDRLLVHATELEIKMPLEVRYIRSGERLLVYHSHVLRRTAAVLRHLLPAQSLQRQHDHILVLLRELLQNEGIFCVWLRCARSTCRIWSHLLFCHNTKMTFESISSLP